MKHAEVVVAKTVIQAQILARLPNVGSVDGEGVLENLALGIAFDDRRGVHTASHKVCESEHIGICNRRGHANVLGREVGYASR